MGLTTISGEIQAQPLNDNFSYLNQKNNDLAYNVRDYGATGDGVTFDTLSIQNTVNAMPSSGGIILFPYGASGNYRLSANITFGSKQIDVIISPNVIFSGTGILPTNLTNADHPIRQNYRLFRPTSGFTGCSTITAEIAPSSTFAGNGVAGFFGAFSPTSGSGGIWALNPIVVLNSGYAGNGIGIEVDLDNYVADYRGEGVLITGVGSFGPEVGCKIKRANSTSDWKSGIKIENSEIALEINLTASATPTYGLYIHGMSKDHIKLVPSVDTNPTDAVLYTTNAADSQVNFRINKEGSIQVGSGGTAIKKHISVDAGVLNFGTITANGSLELTVSISGSATGNTVVATPSIALANGIAWNSYVSAPNVVSVRVINATTTDLDPDGGGGANWHIDVWQH